MWCNTCVHEVTGEVDALTNLDLIFDSVHATKLYGVRWPSALRWSPSP